MLQLTGLCRHGVVFEGSLLWLVKHVADMTEAYEFGYTVYVKLGEQWVVGTSCGVVLSSCM
jgi:hypothetical protein